MPFVGERLAKKIWEIIETGHLRRLDHLDPKMDAINLFADVWGAGPKTAEVWVAQVCPLVLFLFADRGVKLLTHKSNCSPTLTRAGRATGI